MRPFFAFAPALLALACGRDRLPAGAVTRGNGATGVNVVYRANGGMPAVDLELRLGPGGTAELSLGTSRSILVTRVSRVGTFGGTAPNAEVDAIRAFLDEHDMLARAGKYGTPAPHAPGRFIGIAMDGRRAELELEGATGDEDIGTLEDLLQRLAAAMTQKPIRALEASLEITRRDGPDVTAAVVIRPVGEPMKNVVFYEPSNQNVQLIVDVAVVERRSLPSGAKAELPLGSARLSNDAMLSLVRDGKLPTGPSDIASAYRFDVVVHTKPASAARTATGTVSLWVPDDRGRRRQMEIVTPDVSVP